ncbi:MAG: hypothetical protein IPP77_02265 [Bacteroidetes bacterium]|nr:hypothetical protein [Bacteroidota bacterium]
MKKKLLLLTGIFTITALVVSYFYNQNDICTTGSEAKCIRKPEMPLIKFGLDLNQYEVSQHQVKRNEVFAGILSQYNVTGTVINFITRESKSIFNLRNIKAGNEVTVLYDKNDSSRTPIKMIYAENKVDYVVFNLDDSLYIYRGQNNVERKQREVSGVINSSLYETLESSGINPVIAVRLSEIFAWSVDFYRIQKGDRFKILYDEDCVEEKLSRLDITMPSIMKTIHNTKEIIMMNKGTA